VKIDRGCDFDIKPASWVSIEVADFCLRRCHQAKVDIYKPSKRCDGKAIDQKCKHQHSMERKMRAPNDAGRSINIKI
jgi:hypothetical protein